MKQEIRNHSPSVSREPEKGWESLAFVEPQDTDLSADIQLLFRPDVGYAARLAAMWRLPEPLGQREVEGLFLYLSNCGPRDGLVGMEERLLKSAVIDLLVKQPAMSGEIANGLISIYRDTKQDPAIREHAVFYLGSCFDKASPRLRETIRVLLVDAATQGDIRIAGTAQCALKKRTK